MRPQARRPQAWCSGELRLPCNLFLVALHVPLGGGTYGPVAYHPSLRPTTSVCGSDIMKARFDRLANYANSWMETKTGCSALPGPERSHQSSRHRGIAHRF